ncbi:MAG: hypothetical protein JSW16_03405, partial [Dehalococcoidales bacterium]
QLALSLDIPFFPQLPNTGFYEDMYVQTSEHFPGITIDPDNEKILFDNARFDEDLGKYSQIMPWTETFALNPSHSVTYQRFLEKDLQGYNAIRGQVTGPVSFGFRVTDENARPIIYSEGIRALLFDFIQRKVNLQYQQLTEKNARAFVWLDEPGLGWVFSGLSGYNDIQARQEYHSFLNNLDGPRALHLCANVNLPYLLELGTDILSFDAYQMELMPKGYTRHVADFLNNVGIISWGIIPTDSTSLHNETPQTLAAKLEGYWEAISLHTGLTEQQIARQALLAPARCCLKNTGRVGAWDDIKVNEVKTNPDMTVEEQIVERAFDYLRTASQILKNRFSL